MLTGPLCVLMQVRPLLGFEKAKGSSECVEVPSTTVVQLPARRGTSSDPFRFDFDRVYKMNNPGTSESSYFIPAPEKCLAAQAGIALQTAPFVLMVRVESGAAAERQQTLIATSIHAHRNTACDM